MIPFKVVSYENFLMNFGTPLMEGRFEKVIILSQYKSFGIFSIFVYVVCMWTLRESRRE